MCHNELVNFRCQHPNIVQETFLVVLDAHMPSCGANCAVQYEN